MAAAGTACAATPPRPAAPALGALDFELGLADVEVYRYPRFAAAGVAPAAVTTQAPISGLRSLRLPGFSGGYRLITRAVPLQANRDHGLRLRVRSEAQTTLSLGVSVRNRRVGSETRRLEAGERDVTLAFRSSGVDAAVHMLSLRIHSAKDVVIDDVVLERGDERVELTTAAAWLTPDRPLGVYGRGDTGSMDLLARDAPRRYRIVDSLTGAEVDGGPLPGREGTIDLYTARRGHYRVLVNGAGAGLARRDYAVIDPVPANADRGAFGVAMEEHGPESHVNALVAPDELYALARAMGAGAVRIFALAVPGMLSADGIRYDFRDLERALDSCARHALEPMVLLGSNGPDRLPDWLRAREAGPDRIDLAAGLHGRVRERFERQTGRGRYLDLVRYEAYLDRVFERLGGRVGAWEIWNEPGHKFRSEDFVRIAQMTRERQRELDPDALLVGFSSSHRGRPRGEDPQADPRFSVEMARLGGFDLIDVMSFHSAHAYRFFGAAIETRQLEHDYVERLHRVAARAGHPQLPLWNTERGEGWNSDRGRPDKFGGEERLLAAVSSGDPLLAAGRLPLVHASELADGVDRLFWWHFVATPVTIANSANRPGFFDAGLEPMPHLVSYNAMVERLAGARFVRLLGTPGGSLLYLWRRDGEVIGLLGNWRGRSERLMLAGDFAGLRREDVFGRPLAAPATAGEAEDHVLLSTPRSGYLLFDSVRPQTLQLLEQRETS